MDRDSPCHHFVCGLFFLNFQMSGLMEKYFFPLGFQSSVYHSRLRTHEDEGSDQEKGEKKLIEGLSFKSTHSRTSLAWGKTLWSQKRCLKIR